MELLYKSQTRFLFHAHIKIKISAFYADSIFDELYAILEKTDKLYNSYQKDSYIDRINKNAGLYTDVNDETVNILRQVITLSDFFGGTYDITIMPLIRLWGFYREKQLQIPTQQEIDSVKHLINYKNIVIEGNKVKINKGQEIITGSFIKAYAIDKLTERMKELGIKDAIINGGGSTIKAINNESHPLWQVIVKEPQDNSILFKLNISNQAYSTSSQAKTFVNIDGKQYGHILNPKTGFPSTNRHVGIITDNCIIGDIVSTALYNETPEGFLAKAELLSEHYNIAGFLIDENGLITRTENFNT